VKSFDTADAARRIAASDVGCPVLHLQNGIGNFELLREVLPEERILSGMIIIGFTIPAPGRATVTVYGGDIKLGRINGRMDSTLESAVALFGDLPFTTHAVDDIGSHLWAKLLYNCALNPLGAIFNVPYGRLQDPIAQDIIREILAEAFRTAAAHDIPLFWPDSEAYRAFLTATQIPATADHFPSMGADLRAGKRTEIDFLNGAVARLAAERDLPAPVNTTIARQIRFLENAGGADRIGGFSS
jgi:2-dehydropantoate 2-reductase